MGRRPLLEVGCGKSVYLPLVDRKRTVAVAVDISKTLLVLNKHTERILGDGENLAFAPQSFDYVFCIGSIHHMPNKDQALNEIAKVCRKKIYIFEPHSMSANWFYWGARKAIIRLFGYEKVKKWAGFVAPYESFVSKRTIEKNLSGNFRIKIKFYSPFRAPPLKAFNKLNFGRLNDFLEKVPGIRRTGTYIAIEAERICG
jgi:ubiquinone/menaquinone biosynthesis C-methylase UbiE